MGDPVSILEVKVLLGRTCICAPAVDRAPSIPRVVLEGGGSANQLVHRGGWRRDLRDLLGTTRCEEYCHLIPAAPTHAFAAQPLDKLTHTRKIRSRKRALNRPLQQPAWKQDAGNARVQLPAMQRHVMRHAPPRGTGCCLADMRRVVRQRRRVRPCPKSIAQPAWC